MCLFSEIYQNPRALNEIEYFLYNNRDSQEIDKSQTWYQFMIVYIANSFFSLICSMILKATNLPLSVCLSNPNLYTNYKVCPIIVLIKVRNNRFFTLNFTKLFISFSSSYQCSPPQSSAHTSGNQGLLFPCNELPEIAPGRQPETSRAF